MDELYGGAGVLGGGGYDLMSSTALSSQNPYPMREAEAPATSPSQVPGTSGAPSYTPSSTPGGVSTGSGTGTSARTRFKTLIYRKGLRGRSTLMARPALGIMHHPDALSLGNARRWPARHGCPVGDLRHLEVVHARDVLMLLTATPPAAG